MWISYGLPKGDIAAEVAGSEEAEQAAGELQVLVVTHSDRRDAGYGARPDRFLPKLGVGRRSQHYRGNLQHRFVILGELETSILGCFAEVIGLGKVDVTRAATRAVHSGKGRNCETRAGRNDN